MLPASTFFFSYFFDKDGYTSATFSGRSAMPLLADSIVECGRRTLTNAILLAKKWGDDKNSLWSGAHVIYGKQYTQNQCSIVEKMMIIYT